MSATKRISLSLCCSLLFIFLVCAAAPDLDIMAQSAQRQGEHRQNSQAHELAPALLQTRVVTVTQIVSVNPQPTATARATDDSDNKQPESANNSSRSWVAFVILPLSICRALATTSFSYFMRPVWGVAFWSVRVLVYRPAVFIYLLCLEKPLKALISIFLWILPTVAFMMATAIVGTLIGGTTGWVSGMLTGALQSVVSGNKHDRKTADDKPRIDYSRGPRAAVSVRSASEPSQVQIASGLRPLKPVHSRSRRYADTRSSKEEWSRRRQSTMAK
ncbi:hypothetical protein DL89DRAFT_266327 [Linderina pennispora]|uniref:Transmembrane protein n=1 Tax=Linderina pennispora TaxID=61395 RepID=A0A1Y1WCN5_9FUNG|nr:uncharacterized protein DL89DRAFT_266327 [Linderina pennispora]ORX71300.1 hypothetical protein DL89DRAFT_266327 [Linderina pennispora]